MILKVPDHVQLLMRLPLPNMNLLKTMFRSNVLRELMSARRHKLAFYFNSATRFGTPLPKLSQLAISER